MLFRSVLSMLVNVVYNMVDIFCIAKTGDANQIAAVSLATTVFMFLMAAGTMFGVGGSSYISRSLGEKKSERVKHISSFCFYGCIVVGVILTTIILAFMPTILKLCGTSENTAGAARSYITWIAIGAPFVTVSMAFGNLVRAEGSAKTAMIGMMVGIIVNIILDPIFIIGMNMGVEGASIATVIGNICSCIFYGCYISFLKTTFLSAYIYNVQFKDKIARSE